MLLGELVEYKNFVNSPEVRSLVEVHCVYNVCA